MHKQLRLLKIGQMQIQALNLKADWACKSGLLQCRCREYSIYVDVFGFLYVNSELWFFLRECQEFWVCRWLVFRFFFRFSVRWDTNIHPVARGYHFDNETALNGMLNAKKLDHNDTVQDRYFRVWGKKIGISVILLTETDVFFSLPHSCCHLAETFFPNGFEIDSFNFGTRSFSL